MVAKNVGCKKYIGSKTNSRRFVEKLNVKFLKILDTKHWPLKYLKSKIHSKTS